MKGKGDMDVNGMEVFRCRRGRVAVSNDGFTGKKCCVLATVKQCGAKLELWLKSARHPSHSRFLRRSSSRVKVVNAASGEEGLRTDFKVLKLTCGSIFN